MDVRNKVNLLGLFSHGLARLGCVALFAMMGLTVVDVVGRYAFNSPLLGAFELTEFLVLIMVFSFVGYTQAEKSHVTVEILVDRLPRKTQSFIDLFNYGVGLILMTLVTWKGFEKAMEAWATGESPMNLPVPDYPFVFFMAFGCAVMCIEFVRDLLRTWTRIQKGGNPQ